MKRETQIQSPNQNLTGSLTFFNVLTPESIVPTVSDEKAADYFAQREVLEKVFYAIGTRARPVVMGVLKDEGFTIACEKMDAVQVDEIQTLIQEMGAVSFSDDGATTVDLSGVTLVKLDALDMVPAPVTP